jgi:hypothetical protein
MKPRSAPPAVTGNALQAVPADPDAAISAAMAAHRGAAEDVPPIIVQPLLPCAALGFDAKNALDVDRFVGET